MGRLELWLVPLAYKRDQGFKGFSQTLSQGLRRVDSTMNQHMRRLIGHWRVHRYWEQGIQR